MHYDHDDAFLTAAFNAVKQNDSDTFLQMQLADWHITTNMRAFLEAMAGIQTEPMPRGAWLQVIELLTESEGNTIPGRTFCPECATVTFVNPATIARDAAYDGVSNVALYGSATLVHEFTHRNSVPTNGSHARGELDAFKAQEAYGAKVGGYMGRVIESNSKQGMRNVLNSDYPGT